MTNLGLLSKGGTLLGEFVSDVLVLFFFDFFLGLGICWAVSGCCFVAATVTWGKTTLALPAHK